MPFDSFLTMALTRELREKLVGLKVDRVLQPERDEIDLAFRLPDAKCLAISCGAAAPYLALVNQMKENPVKPPMMCMLLRKHLSRAKVTGVDMPAFDRTIRIRFDSGDEMGYRKEKTLYCEMMGRGSNLIFCDETNTILTAFRQNDLTSKFGRVVMTGVKYTPMPPVDRLDPTTVTKEEFLAAFDGQPKDLLAAKALQTLFSGFGKLTAEELAFRASKLSEATLIYATPERLWEALSEMLFEIREGINTPSLVYPVSAVSGDPIDFSFTAISAFPGSYRVEACRSVSEAIERFYGEKDRAERQKQHYNDIYQILKNARNRLQKKITAQEDQLAEASDAPLSRKKADLIMQEMYRIKRGDTLLLASDYSQDPPAEIRIDLDERLSPSRNAQKYYKEYTKKKNALIKVREQIDLARAELDYVDSVRATLDTAISAADLMQIRQELTHWTYGRRMSVGLKKPSSREKSVVKPMELISPGGLCVLIGKNNLQNDAIATKLASKNDWWFHVKGFHGSHVLLKVSDGSKVSSEDLEYAAGLAAYFSEAKESEKTEVDYTLAKFLKKPAGSRPGFVTFKNQKTVLVAPKKPS